MMANGKLALYLCRGPLLFLIVFTCVRFGRSHEEIPRVLLISLDGFRYDYIEQTNKRGMPTPNFQRLIDEGVTVRSPGIQNVFVTKTFPNHYTLVTGLYEENHGIVANVFYDPVFNETFNMHGDSAKDIKWWNGTGKQKVEPIWVTNQVEGGHHHVSGVFMWPGSYVPGMMPKFGIPKYDESVPFKKRADTIAKWFNQEPDPINFGALYYHEPDKTGHLYGPDSIEIAKMVVELDGDIGYLLQVLEKNHILEGLDIILTSDHGMALMNGSIYLDDFISRDLYSWYGASPVLNILPKTGKKKKVPTATLR